MPIAYLVLAPKVDEYLSAQAQTVTRGTNKDKPVETFTYIYHIDGSLAFLCRSLAYGVPYDHDSKVVVKATWVMCIDPKDGIAKPTYVEPHVIVSPFELLADGSYRLPEVLAPEPETKP